MVLFRTPWMSMPIPSRSCSRRVLGDFGLPALAPGKNHFVPVLTVPTESRAFRHTFHGYLQIMRIDALLPVSLYP